jgi:two-component system phosphate regulon sensor histidine kinase PhoR
MPEGLSRTGGLTLVLALPGILVVAALFGFAAIGAATAILAGIAVLVLAVLAAVPFAFSFAAAAEAIARLGPDEPDGIPRHRRLSLAVRAIWPAALRLRRDWRAHSLEIAARLAAAETILGAIPDPLILIDGQRRIVRTNAAADALIGATGRPPPEPRDLAAVLRNPALLAAADAVLREGRGQSVEFALAGPTERVLRASLAPIPEAELRPLRGASAAIIALHEVTELKRAEQMRADFIANAGHELKTPLAALTGFIETLRGPARDDAAARERFLAIMDEQARRMARLVNDLLSLSRIELNEHVAPTGRVALAPLIDEVARGLELRAGGRGIRIACALPADLPEVPGDRDQLAQVFQNLLDNAVSYGRPRSEVRVTGGIADGAQVRVAVTDQGEGIAPEHLSRLTERFYRVDSARSRELGGTGLGLAIVKHILNRHRGRLEIASRPGHGSTFTVFLPAAEPPPAVTQP